MSAVAIRHGGAGRRSQIPPRAATVVIGVAALLTSVALGVGALRLTGDGATKVRAAATPIAPMDAIEAWVDEHRSEVFEGYGGAFLGRCPDESQPRAVGLCTSPVEDLGDHRIDLVGAYASDWGADLLLERGARGWAVIDVAPWPELDTEWFGPPWSPQTAIARWWADAGRAEARFGAGAVHLRSCGEAGDVAGGTGQPLLCSTLVDDRDDERTYRSGLVGAPDTEIELVVRERADHTWMVIEAG